MLAMATQWMTGRAEVGEERMDARLDPMRRWMIGLTFCLKKW